MINKYTFDEDIKKGDLCLRANKINQTASSINELIQFLNKNPEVATLHFFQSSINREFAEKLATITSIKKINFFSHSYVTWDFYKNSNPALIQALQQKTEGVEVSINQKLNLFTKSQLAGASNISEDLDKTNVSNSIN